MDIFNLEQSGMYGAHAVYANSVRERLNGMGNDELQGIVDRYQAKPLWRRLFSEGGEEYAEARFLLQSRTRKNWGLE
jgi:hypothetical protein